MANTLDPMDIKQIFTLHADGLSNRIIADILGISRNTVNMYINWLKASDYIEKELLGMEKQLLENFSHPIPPLRINDSVPQSPLTHKRSFQKSIKSWFQKKVILI